LRTFWLGLAVVVMACAAFGADADDVKVGDWVKTKMTPGTPDPIPQTLETLVIRVKAIENGIATLENKNTAQIPGRDEPESFSWEKEIPIEHLNSFVDMLPYFWGKDGIKVEVLEEGERTVEVNGVTFEDASYQKTKMTAGEEGGQGGLELVIEAWEDGTALFAWARMLKMTVKGTEMLRWASGPTEISHTIERVAYGRVDDQIPEDEETSDKE